MDPFWIVLVVVVTTLVLIVKFYDNLVNMAHLKKTEWAMVYDKRLFKNEMYSTIGFYRLEEDGFGVTFKLTDGTFIWLEMSEDEFSECKPFMFGKLTHRGNAFIRFIPEIPPMKIRDQFPTDGK